MILKKRAKHQIREGKCHDITSFDYRGLSKWLIKGSAFSVKKHHNFDICVKRF